MQEIKAWFNQYFDKAENILLLLIIAGAVLVMHFFGGVIAPFLASLFLAYILNSLTYFLVRTLKIKRLTAIISLFLGFGCVVILIYIKLIPLISNQIALFVQQLPSFFTDFQTYLQTLPARYPRWISQDMVAKISDTTHFNIQNIQDLGKVVGPSLNSLSNIVEWIIYLFLVPIITFLLLKDKNKFKFLFIKNLPVPHGIILTVWCESKTKLGRYGLGILLESIIVGVVYIGVFLAFKINYGVLLGLMGGLVVFMPIVGTLLMTIPVVIIGLFQFGLDSHFIFLMCAYVLVHMLDAYLLAPWLFGRALNLHPLAVLFALVVFGGVLGFWGLVFAIPLATFITIVLDAYYEYGDAKAIKSPRYHHC